MSHAPVYVHDAFEDVTFQVTPTGLRRKELFSGEGAAIQEFLDAARGIARATGSVGSWHCESVFGVTIQVGWFIDRRAMEEAVVHHRTSKLASSTGS